MNIFFNLKEKSCCNLIIIYGYHNVDMGQFKFINHYFVQNVGCYYDYMKEESLMTEIMANEKILKVLNLSNNKQFGFF